MGCLGCGRGFHDECINDGCVNCHPEFISAIRSLTATGTKGHIGAPIKDPENIKDRHSTGRKRAAKEYPLFREQACEWQGKKNCGGGKFPIVGCISGLQQHRHHGPNKDTLRNDPGNIHRICNNCHARWHALNDPGYNEVEWAKLLHAPEPAGEIELMANEAQWRIK